MQSYTDCICLAFLHSVFSNVLSIWIQSHTGCIYLLFLRRAVSNVTSNFLPERLQSHIGCTCLTAFLFLALSWFFCLHVYLSHTFQYLDPSLLWNKENGGSKRCCCFPGTDKNLIWLWFLEDKKWKFGTFYSSASDPASSPFLAFFLLTRPGLPPDGKS